MKVGKGTRSIHFKKAPVYSSLVQRVGHPTAVIVPVEQSYDKLQSSREVAYNGFWWRCVTLPLIVLHVGDSHNLQKFAPQSQRTP